MLLQSVYEIYLYDGYNFWKGTGKEKLPKTRKNNLGLIIDNMGNHCFIDAEGLFTYKDKVTGRVYHFNLMTSGLRKHIKRTNVVTTRKGIIWISTYGNGLFAFDKNDGELVHFTRKSSPDIITTDYIMAIAVDKNDCVWVAGEYAGLTLLWESPRTYHILKLHDDNSFGRDNEVRMLIPLDRDTLIGADNAGNLFFSDRNLSIINFKTTDNKRNIRFISAAKDAQGRLWLGTRRDNLLIDGKAYKSPRTDIILKDRKNRMWLAGLDSGLRVATINDNGVFKQKVVAWKDRNIRALIETRNGYLCVGTNAGLYIFNPDEVNFAPKNYRPNTFRVQQVCQFHIMCMTEDNHNRIIAGTRGNGILLFDSRHRRLRLIEQFTTDDGLPSNVINSIAVSGRGDIVAGTNNGIAVVSPQSKNISTIRFYDAYERNFCRENSIIRLSNGNVAVGTLCDIVVVQKDFFAEHDASLSKPSLTGLLVNGTVPEKKDSIFNLISKGKSLKLPHTHNTITAFCSDFNYATSAQKAFSFFLEGKDKQWSITPTGNSMIYKDLPPGYYKLFAKYRNENGTWSDAACILPLVISPPLWATPWAFAFYGLIVIAVVMVVYRQLRYTYRLRQNIAIEKGITEFKLRFFTDISHEFRSPLTLISNAMQKINETKDVPTSLTIPLQNMRSNVDRMTRLINQLVEFRRMQNGKLKLKLQETEVIAFVYNIFQIFHSIAESKNINYSFTPDTEQSKMFIDRGFVDKILYNLISNAFKYTPEGGHVGIKVRTDNEKLSVVVEDTGIGISNDMQEKLFNRFETGNSSSDGIGIGLNFSLKLAEAHHGNLTYTPNTEATASGSIFTLSIPVNRDSYTAEDYLKERTTDSHHDELVREGYEEATLPMNAVPMNNIHILVVEDDNDIAVMLKQELQQLFIVSLASNGSEALRLLKEEGSNYRLIVSDVMMPDTDGYKLTMTLRKDKKLPYIPIILLTALDSPEAEKHGITCGADAYIIKPFNMKVLKSYCISLVNRYADTNGTLQQVEKNATRAPLLVTNSRDKRFIDAFNRYVEDNLADENLSADTIATAFKMGRTSFYVKVQQLLGKSPTHFIKEYRMEKAAQLLIESNNNIAEIAYAVGYKKPQYFATVFKSYFGLTPKEYRQRTQTTDEQPLSLQIIEKEQEKE